MSREICHVAKRVWACHCQWGEKLSSAIDTRMHGYWVNDQGSYDYNNLQSFGNILMS